MTVKGATAWSGAFVCKDATGALAAASVGPAGVLYVNGTANGASVTISGSNPYKWTLTLPALSAGDYVQMYITATAGGIATAAFVAADAADTKLMSDTINANLTQILGTALTETAGLIAAAFKKFFNVAAPTGTVNSLPDAVPNAAGGLPISTAGGLDLDAMNADVESIKTATTPPGMVLP